MEWNFGFKLFYIEHIRLGYMHIIPSGLSLVTLGIPNYFHKNHTLQEYFHKDNTHLFSLPQYVTIAMLDSTPNHLRKLDVNQAGFLSPTNNPIVLSHKCIMYNAQCEWLISDVLRVDEILASKTHSLPLCQTRIMQSPDEIIHFLIKMELRPCCPSSSSGVVEVSGAASPRWAH